MAPARRQMDKAGMKQQSMTTGAWVSLLALALIWGASFLCFALALRELPVFTVVANRVFWGASALWVYVLIRNIPRPASMRQWSALAVMGLLNNAIPFSLIAWGQTHIESGLASILNGTTAIFAVLIAALVFKDEKLTGRKLSGVILASVGALVVVGPEALRNFDLRSLAQIALLGASLSYACAAVWARFSLSGLHPVMAATGMLTGSTMIMVPLALIVDGTPETLPGATTIAALGFLALPATAVAYLLYYRCLNLAGSGNLSLVTLLVPPTAVFWGAVILNEALSLTAFSGFILIALGMLVLDGRILGSILGRRNPQNN